MNALLSPQLESIRTYPGRYSLHSTDCLAELYLMPEDYREYKAYRLRISENAPKYSTKIRLKLRKFINDKLILRELS